jgi:hypothetical protein
VLADKSSSLIHREEELKRLGYIRWKDEMHT